MPKTMVDKIYIARDENYTSEFWLVKPLDNGVGHEEYMHSRLYPKWLDIESCPIGCPVLCYDKNIENIGDRYEIATKDFEGKFITDVYPRGEYHPTHWSPLLLPPEETK